LEIEDVRRTSTFDDLEIEVVEEGTDEFFFVGGDESPEGGGAEDDGLEFLSCEGGVGGEAVVE
jgi:hypothetical protein